MYNISMKVPYSIQGALFVPALLGLIFILRVTCPEVGIEEGCFADTFATPLFMPAVFMHTVWAGESFVAQYELVFLMLYWIAVLFLLGLCFDLFEDKHKKF